MDKKHVHLPDEILCAILSYCHPRDLLSINLASRNLHRLASAIIYRRVYYLENLKWTSFTYSGIPPLGQNISLKLDRSFPLGFQIRDLTKFYRTIHQSDSLRSCITVACFCFRPADPRQRSNNDNILVVDSILRLIGPQLKFLHVSIPGGYQNFLGHHEVGSTFLDLQEINDVLDAGYWDRIFSGTKSLRRLELFNMEYYAINPTMTCEFRVSNITHLSLDDIDLGNSYIFLTEMLKRPKALTHIHLGITELICGIPGGYIYFMDCVFEGLLFQKSSLEVITFQVYDVFKHGIMSTIPGLRNFSKLKILALPLGVLSRELLPFEPSTPKMPSRPFQFSAENAAVILEKLPSSLEKFQINMPRGRGTPISHSHYWPFTNYMSPEYVYFLCELIHQKPLRFPFLRETIIWVDWNYMCSEFDLSTFPNCSHLVSMCKEAGVQMKAIESLEYPVHMN